MQTRIARATDIRTEQGTAEILAIFLRHHGTGYVDPVEREMTRGLEQSPEKRNKAKGHKFLRCVFVMWFRGGAGADVSACVQGRLGGPGIAPS